MPDEGSHANVVQVPLYLLLVDLTLQGSPRLVASSSMPLVAPPASAASAAQALNPHSVPG